MATEERPAETEAPGEDVATGHAAPTTELAATAESATESEQRATTAPWRTRARLRRRLRFVRSARELALRDLGGLVFDLHRFNRERPDLVTAKIETLDGLERERRELESALGDRREVDLLREPGLAECAACHAVLPSDAKFCSACGQPVGATT